MLKTQKEKLIAEYGSLRNALIMHFNAIHKCSCCKNELNDIGKIRKKDGVIIYCPPKIRACLNEECLSSTIKKGTIEYRIKVLGQDESEIRNSYALRVKRGVDTKRKNGFFEDKSNNPYSVEFWLKKGLSKEAAIQKVSAKNIKSAESKRKNGFFEDKSNNPYSVEFWLKKGLSKEAAIQKVKERNHCCEEFWEKRGFNKRDAEAYAKRSAATLSIENKNAKYGEKGLEKFVEHRFRISQGWKPSAAVGKNFSSSRAANTFFKKLYKFFRLRGFNRNDFMMNLNRGEFFIREKDSIYFYDFLLKPLKLIIEFNGEHVHPPVHKLSETNLEKWRHAFSKKTASEVIQMTENKYDAARKLGYNIIEVWSQDSDSEKFLKILNFIGELK